MYHRFYFKNKIPLHAHLSQKNANEEIRGE